MYRFERDEGVPDPEAWKMWRLVLRPRDGVSCRVSLLEAEVGEKAAVEAA